MRPVYFYFTFIYLALGQVRFSELFHANNFNPFASKTVYPNPTFTQNVKNSAQRHPEVASLLQKVENVGAATWIDNMAHISLIEPILKGAQQTGQIAMFVIYDLPNRDCAAAASNGEISCEDSNCAQGLNIYKTQYIGPIISIFKRYPSVTIVAIVEPDSLPNLATNLGVQKCSQAEKAYKQGVSYTLAQLYSLGNVVSYLDSAHGGWLGWDNNLQKISVIFQEVLNNAGGKQVVRGFVTNSANYQALGSLSSTDDPCHLQSQWNFCIDEIHFIDRLNKALEQVGLTGMYYLTDTSRNGVSNMRKDCSNWCNIKNSGLGVRPTANVASLGLNNLDALVWVKTPGESDGTSDQGAGRFDFHCSSQDSYIPSPEAGQWHEDFFIMLAKNANPPL